MVSSYSDINQALFSSQRFDSTMRRKRKVARVGNKTSSNPEVGVCPKPPFAGPLKAGSGSAAVRRCRGFPAMQRRRTCFLKEPWHPEVLNFIGATPVSLTLSFPLRSTGGSPSSSTRVSASVAVVCRIALNHVQVPVFCTTIWLSRRGWGCLGE